MHTRRKVKEKLAEYNNRTVEAGGSHELAPVCEANIEKDFSAASLSIFGCAECI